jgi:hypothetical protein
MAFACVYSEANKQSSENIMKKHILAAAILASTLMGTHALATTGGALGATSSDSTDVNLTVPSLVQLSFPGADIDMSYSDGSDSIVTEEFCIYSNQATVDFDISVSTTNSPASGTSPVMENAGGSELAYQLDLKTAGGGTTLAGNIQTSGATVSDTNANQTSKDCSAGGNSHQFTVTVLETAIESAEDGQYSDTVNVTVAAN